MIDPSIKIEKLAEKGLPDPQCTIAARYYYGLGKPQSYEEAARWFHRAADQGHAEAQYNLGNMYRYGQGVPKDYEEAANWYREAAKRGSLRAQSDLNFMYRVGHIKPDIAMTAEQGNLDEQYRLGCMYKYGMDVPKDSAEAVKWFRMAAEQGHVDSQLALGYMYNNGMDVNMDFVEGYKWYERAAEQGDEGAKTIIASMQITRGHVSSEGKKHQSSEQPESNVAPSITLLMEKVDRLEKSEKFWKENTKRWEGITASVHKMADKIATELLELRSENAFLKRKLDECGAQAPSEGSHEEQPPGVRL